MACRIQLVVSSEKESATKCRDMAPVVALVRGWPGTLPGGNIRPLPSFPDADLQSGEGSLSNVVGAGRAGTEMVGAVG